MLTGEANVQLSLSCLGCGTIGSVASLIPGQCSCRLLLLPKEDLPNVCLSGAQVSQC